MVCGGGFNEYKYNLSFQNLIQLKSKSLFAFFATYVRLSRAKIWLRSDWCMRGRAEFRQILSRDKIEPLSRF